MKGGMSLGQALGVRRSRCPGDGRGPGTPPQALRGVGRVCRRSPCMSRLVSQRPWRWAAAPRLSHRSVQVYGPGCCGWADGSLEMRVLCVLWASIRMRNALSWLASTLHMILFF